jgi:hypothetical protein
MTINSSTICLAASLLVGSIQLPAFGGKAAEAQFAYVEIRCEMSYPTDFVSNVFPLRAESSMILITTHAVKGYRAAMNKDGGGCIMPIAELYRFATEEKAIAARRYRMRDPGPWELLRPVKTFWYDPDESYD